jgi:hypothetical protein
MPSQNSIWNSGRNDATQNKGPAPVRRAPAIVQQTYNAGYEWAKKQAQIAANKPGKK